MKKLINHLKKDWYKYVLEVIVIIIGILGAYALDNWNESRKDGKKEREILNDLVENLEINIRTIESDIENLYKLDRSSEIILSSIYNRQPYIDTLASHFHIARIPKRELFLSQTGYQGFKDIGLQILTNKELKKEVLTLFETTYPRMLSNYKMVNTFYPDFDNHVVQNFIYSSSKLVPVDYQKLLDDHYYISWIRAYKEGRISLINLETRFLNGTRRIHQLIKNELK